MVNEATESIKASGATAHPTPAVLWSPNVDALPTTEIAQFTEFLNQKHGLEIPIDDYVQLHEWSINNLGEFWQSVADFAEINFTTSATTPLINDGVEHATWFPGATLNYAERALAITGLTPEDSAAIIAIREGAPTTEFSRGELRAQVACAQEGLRRLGVTKGDRVVALIPNCAEAVVAFLATASLGATWSSCSPEFGADAVIDRFSQLEPTVFIAVDGYRYGGKEFDVTKTVTEIQKKVPSLRETVLIPYLNEQAHVENTVPWRELLDNDAETATFTPVPFEHPLWVLFSSGTTGMPKGIVQGHGGILLEHAKSLRLHNNLKPGSIFFWFTTTGWMMWNYLVSGLTVGATVVLFDGNPIYPDMRRLWSLAEEYQIDLMGVSAPFIHACMKEDIHPGSQFNLKRLSTIGSTGAPLSPEGFNWIAQEVGHHIQISSISGGTDVCTAFLTSAPNLPIWLGELSCAALGVDVRSVNDHNEPLINEVGELVITTPMPSMPVSFWNDADGSKLHDAYFADIPGVWRHGDWCVETERGSFKLLGRSDATLNRGGVRMGTAEFYQVSDAMEGVVDSLVVDVDELICFLVLAENMQLADIEPALRTRIRKALSPRHVPDEFIVVDAIPKTLNGKKCEVPIKRILMGADPKSVINPDSLQDPDSLAPFIALAAQRP